MEQSNLGGAEQMELRQQITEGHERWIGGAQKTWTEEHPKLAAELGLGTVLAGGVDAATLGSFGVVSAILERMNEAPGRAQARQAGQ